MGEQEVVFTGVFDARQRQLDRLTRRYEQRSGKKHPTLRRDHHDIAGTKWLGGDKAYEKGIYEIPKKRKSDHYHFRGKFEERRVTALDHMVMRASSKPAQASTTTEQRNLSIWRSILDLPGSLTDQEKVQRSADLFFQTRRSTNGDRNNRAQIVNSVVALDGTEDAQPDASFAVEVTMKKGDAHTLLRNSRRVFRTPDEQHKAELSYSDQTHTGFLQLRERDGIRLHDIGVVGLSVESDNRYTRINFVGSAVNLQTTFAILSATK